MYSDVNPCAAKTVNPCVAKTVICYLKRIHTRSALKGFVKLKKDKKSEKNSEVGGWFMAQLGFLIFFGVVFMFQMFQKKLKNG